MCSRLERRLGVPCGRGNARSRMCRLNSFKLPTTVRGSSFRDGALAPDPESRDSGLDASHRPGMTSHVLAIPQRDPPEFCINRSRLDKQRAQGKPGGQCTRSLACEIDKAHERSHHRFTGNRPAFPAQWFYGLLRALPGDHALLTPSPARLHADLTPALGRQNHTTWPYASASFVRLAIARLTLPRPPHPAPNVRDDREAPLLWARDGGSPSADLPEGKSGIFLISGLDTISENQK